MTATASATPYIATVCLRSLPYTPPLLWLLCLVPACPPARLPACLPAVPPAADAAAAGRRGVVRSVRLLPAAAGGGRAAHAGHPGQRSAACTAWHSVWPTTGLVSSTLLLLLQHVAVLPSCVLTCAASLKLVVVPSSIEVTLLPAPLPPCPLPIGPPAPLLPVRSCMPAQTTASPAPASGCTSCWAMPRASSSQ